MSASCTLGDLLPGSAQRAARVAEAARQLEGREPGEIIDWALGIFGAGLGFTTALGYGGIVLLDLLRRRTGLVEAHFIDTGHHFDETIELLGRIEAWSDAAGAGRIRFIILRPEVSDEDVVRAAGSPPWKVNPDVCCRLRKVEPLQRIIHTRDAWLSALRRDQAQSRAQIDVVRLDGRGVLKIHPLAGWTARQCWDYIGAHGLPYNPLHDCGYPSVGCTHCTVPVYAGEHERTGRWASIGKTECGLHT
ncbi:MAG: phosphoadenylyl-sulfate reductase [Phycisphaerales bacterium JB039]